MKKYIAPLVIILLFAAIVAGSVYLIAQVASVQGTGAGSVAGSEASHRNGRITTGVEAGEEGFGHPEGRHSGEFSLARALPELVKNIMVIAAIVALTVTLQKKARVVRHRQATG